MNDETSTPAHSRAKKVMLICLAVTILVIVYLFQRVDLAGALVGSPGVLSANGTFIANRVMRLVINDLACFLVIYALFPGKRYLTLALWIFLIELLVLLPAYLVIKLTLEGPSEISSPLLSQVHRLIVNPTLMLLLIAGFLYQNYTQKQRL